MNVSGLTSKIVAAGFLAACMMSASVSLTGCLTDNKKDTTAVYVDTSKHDSAKHTPWGPETVIQAGAQGNTALGSAIDLDTKKALLSNAALAAQGTIDLVMIYSDSSLQLTSPVFAKAAGDVPLATAYDATKIHDTQIARISTKPEDSELAASTFEQTPKLNNSFLFDGGAYLVKTDKGKIAYVGVSNLQGDGSTASATFTISLSGL
jgi:hypothetical protein